MTWNLFRWVWRLEAPLSIGMPPAGALNRCRLYVPARVLWGAVTAEISRARDGEKFPDYGKLGWEIALNCRFTYLYPAEKIDGNYLTRLPEFEQPRGLMWRCQDGREKVTDREFRRRLLDARPGTAIEPETDSASEATLRETECISPWWRNLSGHEEKHSHVFLLGYVFLRKNGFRRQIENIETLFVGGDTRYGLGKISRVGWRELSGDSTVFGKPTHLDKEDPEIQSNIVWGHALESSQDRSNISGTKELLGGWDQGIQWQGFLAWIPGSYSEDELTWSIDNYGYWIC